MVYKLAWLNMPRVVRAHLAAMLDMLALEKERKGVEDQKKQKKEI